MTLNYKEIEGPPVDLTRILNSNLHFQLIGEKLLHAVVGELLQTGSVGLTGIADSVGLFDDVAEIVRLLRVVVALRVLVEAYRRAADTVIQ